MGITVLNCLRYIPVYCEGRFVPVLCGHSWHRLDPYRVCGCTTSGRYVRILDLREGNEESSEEARTEKARVYAEFDFRHFERHMMFSQSDRKTYKKAISDGVNVSVVLDVGCGNT